MIQGYIKGMTWFSKLATVPLMKPSDLNPDLLGWWRITENEGFDDKSLDLLGPAVISITGKGDRLRMFALLAEVTWEPTKTGASFTWSGSWEYDPMSGTGSVKLAKDGKLAGRFKIKNGDGCTFIAERTAPPKRPIPEPPSYRDKWRRKW